MTRPKRRNETIASELGWWTWLKQRMKKKWRTKAKIKPKKQKMRDIVSAVFEEGGLKSVLTED